MPTLKELPHLDLCRLEDSLAAAAGEFRYSASQLERATIAIRSHRFEVAETAISNHLDGLRRAFDALGEIYESET